MSIRQYVSLWTVSIVAELVAVLGFIFPWNGHEEGFLSSISETLLIILDLHDGVSIVSIYYPIAFLTCLLAGLISLVLMLLGNLARFAWLRSPRIICVLNSLMIAGPLIFVQRWPYSTMTMLDLIGQTDLGWVLTLAGGLLVIGLSVCEFYRTGARSSRSPESTTKNRTTPCESVLVILLVLGASLVIFGFTQTWITGAIADFSVMRDPWSWNVVGADLDGPMFLVLVAALLSIALVIASQITGSPRRDTAHLAAEIAVTLLLGLTVFFCFTFPVHAHNVEAHYVNVELQFGLYSSVLGELVMLTALVAQDLRALGRLEGRPGMLSRMKSP